MVGSAKPVHVSALEAVLDIAKPYDGYHADLVDILTKAINVLRTEPSERGQLRATENLVKAFAEQVSAKLGE